MKSLKKMHNAKDELKLKPKILEGVVGKEFQHHTPQAALKQQSKSLSSSSEKLAIELTTSKSFFSHSNKTAIKLISFLSIFFVAGLAVDSVLNLVHSRPWLGYLLALIAAILVCMIVYKIIQGIQSRKRINRLQYFKHKFILIAGEQNKIKTNCSELSTTALKIILQDMSKNLPLQFSTQVPLFLSSIESHHDPQELLNLYDLIVLRPLDNAAKKIIIKSSAKVAGVVAISTLPLLDTIATFWFSQRLLKQLAILYGYPTVSTWYLLKSSVSSAILAGGTEALLQLSSDDLLSGLSEKLSSRLAQGAASGILSARLGFAAQTYLRHLPFSKKTPNVLFQIVKELKQQIFSSSKESAIQSEAHQSDSD